MRVLRAGCAFLFLNSLAFAKSKAVPEWVENYRATYPAAEYLAQRGSGDSAERAKNDATAALSRYFKTSVNANLSTTMTSVTVGNSIEEKTLVVDDVNVLSQVDFFGLEYTEPYYLKSEKKWYCVVFINRLDAWTQYKPQIELKKNAFSGLYKNLEKENDYFTRLGLCKKLWASGTELLEKLEYGRIINPVEEAFYQDNRDKIANIPVIFEEAKSNCSIYVQLNSDYNRAISTALSNAFSECGFKVVKNQNEANYLAAVEVEDNVSGSEPLSINPAVNLKILNGEEKSVYSYEILAGEKALGYTLGSAQKKIYPKLSKELEDAVEKDLSSVFKL